MSWSKWKCTRCNTVYHGKPAAVSCCDTNSQAEEVEQ